MTRYTHQINETFDAFFTPDLKEHLDKMGISLETSKPAVCDNGPYSPSSPCSRFSGSGYIKLNSSSVEKWQQSSKQLDDYLKIGRAHV